MKLAFAREDEIFREEVCDFLAENLSAELREYSARMTSVYASKEIALAWQAILHNRGWAAPKWPTAYGGCDWRLAQYYIFAVELARAGAPPLSPMGIGMCGPALIGHGSEEQKAYYLPRILSGEDFWCQGYSEPHAGSDLAALTMTATVDGDDLICSGTKIWTTHGHEANMCFCLVRSDNSGKPQEGISFVLIDMTQDGVQVDPIIMLSGEHIQNTLFFNDVRVASRDIVGKINQGWTVAKYLLSFERGGSSYGPALLARLASLRTHYGEAAATAEMAHKIAQLEVELSSLEAAELHMMSELSSGATPGLKASMMKIKGTELSQRLTELAIELAGNYVMPFQAAHLAPGGPIVTVPASNQPLVGEAPAAVSASKYLNDRAGSIYAGSNEIQRNILAKGQLGF